MTRSYDIPAWSLTGDRPLYRALLLTIKCSKKSYITVDCYGISYWNSTWCECENINRLPGLLCESRFCCYQHQKQHVWYIVLDTQQSFPVFSFSSKNSRIPFSLGHCHSQYVYYNIYLSIIRNCGLIINEINSPNFVNQLPLSRYTPIYLWQSHIKITCNGFIQKYFLTGKTLLFFILSW